MNQQVESIARAFHDVEDDVVSWDLEPEILKEEFRRLAREAIALLIRAGSPLPQDSDPLGFAWAA